MTHIRNLTSPNPTCRRVGCQSCVPPQGHYAGLPQSHCPRCGMKTGHAVDRCPDFVTPIYPEVHFRDRLIAAFDAFDAFFRNLTSLK